MAGTMSDGWNNERNLRVQAMFQYQTNKVT